MNGMSFLSSCFIIDYRCFLYGVIAMIYQF